MDQAAVAAVFAVLMISSEYSSGMIRITMTAVPRRVTVLTAKATIVSGLVLAAGIIAVAGSLLAGHAILPGHGFTPAHGYLPLTLVDGPVLRAATGSVLYLALIALLSLGIATIIWDPGPSIGAVLGLLYLAPIIAAVVHGTHWQGDVERYAPMTAGLTIQATTSLRSLPISPWAGLGAWAAGALLLGGPSSRCVTSDKLPATDGQEMSGGLTYQLVPTPDPGTPPFEARN